MGDESAAESRVGNWENELSTRTERTTRESLERNRKVRGGVGGGGVEVEEGGGGTPERSDFVMRRVGQENEVNDMVWEWPEWEKSGAESRGKEKVESDLG